VTDLAGGATAAGLAQMIAGNGVTVSNVTYTGNAVAAGTFTGGADALGMDSGVVLSTGTAKGVVGPQQPGSFTGQHPPQPGDADLNALAGAATLDASVLQFDFVPQGDLVTLQYVFGSNEYNAFVNSAYHDQFGIFLNGQDVALVPGTGDPVGVNSVNLQTNAQYFVNNAGPKDPAPAAGPLRDTQLPGFTVVLTVTAHVDPGQTNHLKLAIANTGDPNVDSDVFFQASSLSADTVRPTHPLRYIVNTEGSTLTWEAPLQMVTPPATTGQPTALLPTLTPDVVANASGVTASGVPFINLPSGSNAAPPTGSNVAQPPQTIYLPIQFPKTLKKPLSTVLDNFEVLISQA
jgi:hypothetical protein